MDILARGQVAATRAVAPAIRLFQRAVSAPAAASSTDGRLPYLDALRALSIYCIVLAHCFPSHEHSPLRKLIYIFHVPLLFVVSGYLIDVDKRRPFLRMAWNRFKGTMLPYLFWIALLDPIYYALSHRKLPAHTYVSDLLFASGHLSFVYLWSMWILPALFLGWLASYILLKHVRNFGMQAAICFLCLVVSFFASAKTNFATPLPHALVYFGFLRLFAVIPFFMAGYWFKKYDLVSISGNASWLLIAESAGLALVLGYSIQPLVTINRYIYGNFFVLFVAASAASLALLLLASKIRSYPRAVLFFGQNTIIVLVLHHWLVILLKHKIDHFNFSQPALWVLSFVVSMGLTLALLRAAFYLRNIPLLNTMLGIAPSRETDRRVSTALHGAEPLAAASSPKL